MTVGRGIAGAGWGGGLDWAGDGELLRRRRPGKRGKRLIGSWEWKGDPPPELVRMRAPGYWRLVVRGP